MPHRTASAIAAAVLMTACASAGGAVGCAPADRASGSISVSSGFNVTVCDPAARSDAPSIGGELLFDRAAEDLGATVDAALLHGRIGVVNFWGTWCGPCRREQAGLEKVWREYRDRGVRFLGVNSRRDQLTAALAYLDEFDVTYPAVFDPDSSIAARFGVRFMPATYVTDRDGKVAAVIIGALANEVDLRKVLDAELAR